MTRFTCRETHRLQQTHQARDARNPARTLEPPVGLAISPGRAWTAGMHRPRRHPPAKPEGRQMKQEEGLLHAPAPRRYSPWLREKECAQWSSCQGPVVWSGSSSEPVIEGSTPASVVNGKLGRSARGCARIPEPSLQSQRQGVNLHEWDTSRHQHHHDSISQCFCISMNKKEAVQVINTKPVKASIPVKYLRSPMGSISP